MELGLDLIYSSILTEISLNIENYYKLNDIKSLTHEDVKAIISYLPENSIM